MEERAIDISFDLWQQIMTDGYTSGGIHCIQGLPEDAELVEVFWKEEGLELKPTPVFAFRSRSWSTPTPKYTIQSPKTGCAYRAFAAEFGTAECRTCKWWNEAAWGLTKGETDREFLCCSLVAAEDQNKSDALLVTDGNADLVTTPDFGCNQYEPRETDD